METREQIEQRVRNQVRKTFTKQAPADGIYQFVVTSTAKLENPSRGDREGKGAGCPTVAMRVAPLAIEGDRSSVKMQYETTVWLTLPVLNPDIENHIVDDTTSNKFKNIMAAVAPDRVPYVAAKNPDGTWDNSKATKERQLQARIDAEILAAEINEGTFNLDDLVFYATAKKAEGKDGYYVNGLRSELAPGETLSELV